MAETCRNIHCVQLALKNEPASCKLTALLGKIVDLKGREIIGKDRQHEAGAFWEAGDVKGGVD